LDIAQGLGSTLEQTQVLKLIAQRAAQAVGAERCSINLWRHGHMVPVTVQFADGHMDAALWAKFKALRSKTLETVPAHTEVIRTKRPVVITDAATHPLAPAYWEAFGMRSALLIPLTLHDEVIGTLNLDQPEGPYTWSQAQIELGMTIANQAALALENARLFTEAERRRREAEVVAELAKDINASLDLDTVLQRIAEGAKELCRSDQACITLPDSGSEAMRFRCWAGVSYEGYDNTCIEPGKGLGGQVLLTGHPFRTENYAEDPRSSKDDLSEARTTGTVALMGVSIHIGNRLEGVLFVANSTPRPFTDRMRRSCSGWQTRQRSPSETPSSMRAKRFEPLAYRRSRA
jgi:two-component system, NarL family, sensor histidine kinase UhpB